MSNSTLTKYVFLFLFLSVGLLFSQNNPGKIVGVVTDSLSGATLVGANVMIDGTSIGTATDIDGAFKITKIQPGNYTLKISYIGYNSKSIDFKLKSGKTVSINVALTPVAIKGKTVVVTAQAQGQNEAINRQIASIPIMNIVSSTKIKELPDENAAAALARVPGISVSREGGEANKIRIRGVSQNAFYVNGMRMTGDNLAAISSGMIGGMEVQKSFTPDRDADVTGGIVNLKMNGAPSGFKGDFWIRGGYNGLSKSYNMFYGMVTLSDRFFNDKLGVVFNFTYDRKDRSADVFSSTFTTIGSTASSEDIKPAKINSLALSLANRTNDRIGVTIYSDYRIKGGKLYFQSFFGKLNSDNEQFNNGYHPFDSFYKLLYQSQINENDKITFLNGIGGEHELFLDGKLDWALSYSHEKEDIPHRIILNAAHGNGMQNGNLIDSNTTIQEFLAMADHDINDTQLLDVSVDSTVNLINEFSAKLDLNFPFKINNTINGFVKFGGKARNIHREFFTTTRQSEFRPGGWVDGTSIALERLPNFGWKRTLDNYLGLGTFLSDHELRDYSLVDGKVYFPPDFDKINEYVDATYDTYSYRVSAERNNYKGDQDFYAGYIMAGIKIGDRINFIPGVRYEYNEYSVTGISISSSNNAGNTDRNEQGDYREVTDSDIGRNWFPMAQLKIKITENSDIKFAYSTTVSRPDPTFKSPKYYESMGNVVKGNMELKPQTNYNYDISASIYSNVIGLFNISLFYKKITDQVLNRSIIILDPKKLGLPDAFLGKSFSMPINNKWDGFVKGIEFDWQTHFWYLPGFLDGFLLSLNMTLMDSETRYPFFVSERVYVGPPLYYKNVGKDSSRVNTIIGMPKVIANATLGYEKGGFSGRFSVYYQGETIQNAQAANKSLDVDTDDLLRFDVQLSQKIYHDNLIIYWNINNLTNWPDAQSLTYHPEFLAHQENYGWTTEIGLRYKIQ